MTVNEYGEMDQERMMEETNARISEILRPFGNFLNNGLQRDTFIMSDALLRDIESLN